MRIATCDKSPVACKLLKVMNYHRRSWAKFRNFAPLRATQMGAFTLESNDQRMSFVYTDVRTRCFWAVPLLLIAGASAFDSYTSASRKFEEIDGDRLKPGTRVTLTPQELDAYVAHVVPDGVRNPRLELPEAGLARGSALIDFGRVRRAQGHPPGWLMARLLDGERPVTVTARIRSANGSAVVDVQRVEISGMVIDGATLDFLIQNVLLPMYPNAAVGRPFELRHRIERIDVQRGGVGVVIGR